MEQSDNNRQTHEIDIIALLIKVLKEWKTLFKFGAISGFLGVVIALCVSKTYSSTVILAPETSTGTSQFSELAGVASTLGVNIGSLGSIGMSDDAITPLIFPNIFTSLDFLLPLAEIPVMENMSDTIMTYERHVFGKDLGKEPLLVRLKQKMTGKKKYDFGQSVNSGYYLTTAQYEMFKHMIKNIGCVSDKKTDIITISVKDEDPLVAAIVVDTIQNRLQQYIIDYRTKKVKTDLSYYSRLLDSATEDYHQAKQVYSDYSETHKGNATTGVHLTEEFLQNEMEQKYNIMIQYQLQVHSAMSKVQESTPAFAVIQKSYVPVKASSMSRSQMVVIAGFMGLLLGCFWIVVGRTLFVKFRNKH